MDERPHPVALILVWMSLLALCVAFWAFLGLLIWQVAR